MEGGNWSRGGGSCERVSGFVTVAPAAPSQCRFERRESFLQEWKMKQTDNACGRLQKKAEGVCVGGGGEGGEQAKRRGR